jgi:predicted dienelactone hydrolase
MWTDIALLFGAALMLLLIRTDHRWLHWLSFAMLSTAGLLHIVLQGHRWQMLPAYLVFVLIGFLLARRRSTQPGNLSLAVGLLLVSVSAGLSFALPVFSLPAPTGAWSIGTTERLFTDESRAERFANHNLRRLPVRIWYPSQPHDERSTYWEVDAERNSALAKGLQLPAGLGFLFSHIARVQTHSAPDVEVADERFPVLVFSHGLNFGHRRQNTVLMQHLASHGFVVAAIEHAYWGLRHVFPDGEVATSEAVQTQFNSLFQQERTDELDALPLHDKTLSLAALETHLSRARAILQESTNAHQVGIETWSADQRFILDQLPLLESADPLLVGRLDTTRVGVFGMSYGGTASMQTCSVDPRCAAGVNIDGYQLTMTDVPPLSVPFMTVAEARFGWHRPAHERALADNHLVLVEQTQHANFTDFALIF